MVLPQKIVFAQQSILLRGMTPISANPYRRTVTKTTSKAQAKKASAEKHKLAERGRRKRINQQFDCLRTVLPNLNKTDKASVLTEAIRQVRELKKNVKEIKAVHGARLESLLPGEKDSLSLACCEKDGSLVKATFSCEDRRELVSDLTKALRIIAGRAVRTEVVMVGGRVKAALWVKGFSGNERMAMLKSTLQRVVDTPSASCNYKRLRFP